VLRARHLPPPTRPRSVAGSQRSGQRILLLVPGERDSEGAGFPVRSAGPVSYRQGRNARAIRRAQGVHGGSSAFTGVRIAPRHPSRSCRLHRLGPGSAGLAPDDSDYNRAVRHPHRLSADRMFRGDPLYDICIVTDHNRDPVIPCAGSAIFVHLWRRPRAPTAGCVAFRRTDLEWILKRWSRRSRLIFRSRGGL